MTLYRKGSKTVNGYKLVKADGSIVLNAPKEMWEEEGWYEVTGPIALEEEHQTLEDLRENTIVEAEDFYESVALKVNFQGELLWIPFNDRVGYKSYLEDIKEAGITEYNWHGVTLTVDEALALLRQINVYEFNCTQVFEQHKAIINSFNSEVDIENYDYTTGYPEIISL